MTVLKTIGVAVLAFFVAVTFLLLIGFGTEGANGPDAYDPLKILEVHMNYTLYRDTETNVLYVRMGKEMEALLNQDGTLRLYEGGNQ